MKVNNTPAREDFCPACEVCEKSIHENPVYYVELDSDGVQTRYGARERQYVHKNCLKKCVPY